MKTQRKLLIRIVSAAIALLATITWVGEAEADSGYALPIDSTTATVEVTITATPKPDLYTLFSVGWGGGK